MERLVPLIASVPALLGRRIPVTHPAPEGGKRLPVARDVDQLGDEADGCRLIERILVRGDSDSPSPCLLDQLDRVLEKPPVAAPRGFEVGDIDSDPGLLTDTNRLPDRIQQPGGFVAHVGDVESVEFSHGLRNRDDLVGAGVDMEPIVLDAGADAPGSFFHGLTNPLPDRLEFLGGGGSELITHDLPAHVVQPHGQDGVGPDAGRLPSGLLLDNAMIGTAVGAGRTVVTPWAR